MKNLHYLVSFHLQLPCYKIWSEHMKEGTGSFPGAQMSRLLAPTHEVFYLGLWGVF